MSDSCLIVCPILCPCTGETQILTYGDAFCVALRRENSPAAKRKFRPPETRFVWPCARKTARPSVSRRRNANFELPGHIFVALCRRNATLTSGDASSVQITWSHEESRPEERKSPRRYMAGRRKKHQKTIPSHGFAQAKRKF